MSSFQHRAGKSNGGLRSFQRRAASEEGEMVKDFIVNPGQVVEFEGFPKSTVVEVDFRRLYTPQGTFRWKRWTLEPYTTNTAVGAPNERWYIMNVPGLGAHFCRAAQPQRPNHEPNENLSGRLEVISEGDDQDVGIIKASRRGQIETYTTMDGRLFLVETYQHNGQPEDTRQEWFEAYPYSRAYG